MSTAVVIHTRFEPPGDLGFDTGPDSRTKQEFRDECDINRIMSRYASKGVLPAVANPGLYGDFSNAGDYQAAQNLLIRAGEQFAALDSKVRERFGNDPRRFLEFVSNKDNVEEARKLGMMAPVPPVAPPVKVEVVGAPAPVVPPVVPVPVSVSPAK